MGFFLPALLLRLECIDVWKEVNVGFLFVDLFIVCAIPHGNILAILPVTDHKGHLLAIEQILLIQGLDNLVVLLWPLLNRLLLQTLNVDLFKVIILLIVIKLDI